MLEFSGPQWCIRFPGSAKIEDLAQPFQGYVAAFIEELTAAGASVSIGATWRPAERAFLMHWCCLVANGAEAPVSVPDMAGIDIDWTHAGDTAGAVQAAKAMMAGYGIEYPAALVSRHTQRLAIDMTISWKGIIRVADARGIVHSCAAQADLWPIGASFRVVKLPADAPHWSSDGH
jgi:hypothetical protein